MKAIDAINFYHNYFTDFDLKKAIDMLDFMKLDKNEKVSSMSKGMIEKLNLILTFSRDAKLFVLDEPLGGVDPVARESFPCHPGQRSWPCAGETGGGYPGR